MKTTDDARFALFGLVGNALYRLQLLEDLICRCWLNFSEAKEIDGEIYQDFDSPHELYHLKKKRTLGVLVADVKSTGLFRKNFELRFERYLQARNRLVHRIFTESQFSSLGRVRALSSLQRFVVRFINETIYFTEVFDAYLGLHFSLEMENGRLESDHATPAELKKSFDRLLSRTETRRKMKLLRDAYKKHKK